MSIVLPFQTMSIKASHAAATYKTKETHHGGAALVELHSTLFQLGLLVKRVPAKIQTTFGIDVAKVAGELGGPGNIL